MRALSFIYSREVETWTRFERVAWIKQNKRGSQGDQSWKNRDDILSKSVTVTDHVVGWRLTDPCVGTLWVRLAEAGHKAWQCPLSWWSGRQSHLLWVRGVCQVGVSGRTLTSEIVYYEGNESSDLWKWFKTRRGNFKGMEKRFWNKAIWERVWRSGRLFATPWTAAYQGSLNLYNTKYFSY